MTPIRRMLLLALAAVMLLGMTACAGQKKTVEFTGLTLTEDEAMLMIEFTARGDIPAGEGAFRIGVSGEPGEVYCVAPAENELKDGTRHVKMFTMRPLLNGQIEWKTMGTVTLPGGAAVTDKITTNDILALFGDSAVITVAFQVNGETVATKRLGE